MSIILFLLSVGGISVIGLIFNLFYQNGRIQSNPQIKNKIKIVSNEIVDIIRPGWCKRVLSEFGESCCHIFDYIQRSQGNEPWGTVLDAGTGAHSLEWLLSLPTKGITAITGDPKRQAAMENIFKNKLQPKDRIITGNWKDPKLLEGKVFDVVLADYLLGSLDGYAPYYQDRLFERIKPHVGKRLYVVGAEPFPDREDGNPHAQIIIEISKLRDACILLAGDRPYREYPAEWVLRNLKTLGYKIVGVSFFETTYHQEFVETQLNVAETKLARFSSEDLAEEMQAYIDKIRSRVQRMSWGIKWGSDYVIVAEPIRNTKESRTTEEPKLQYKSPILEQDAIFPRDEE